MRFLKRNGLLLLLSAVAALLMTTGEIDETRSAFEYESELYKGQVEMKNIGLTLRENGVNIATRDNLIQPANSSDGTKANDWYQWDNFERDNSHGILQGPVFAEGNYLHLGQPYEEALSVYNSGSIPTYCRMIIRRYWTEGLTANEDPDDPDRLRGKRLNLDPRLIDIKLTGNWIEDTTWADDNEHPETIVLFYPYILQPQEESLPATSQIIIDGFLATKATQYITTNANGSKTIKTVYDYDGIQFNVEVEAEAVQTHNASPAMISAWGKDYL